jgi:hypothetical protein
MFSRWDYDAACIQLCHFPCPSDVGYYLFVHVHMWYPANYSCQFQRKILLKTEYFALFRLPAQLKFN